MQSPRAFWIITLSRSRSARLRLAAACAFFGGLFAPAQAAEPPWQREQTLQDAAASATIESDLDPDCPQPVGGPFSGDALLLSNPSIKASLWGPANRITLSLLKTDVFDRRYANSEPVTLAQISAGAYSPANQGFDDMPPGWRRPVRGYLLPKGGRVEPYAGWNAYPFPCQKPVGQVILGLDELSGAGQPHLVQSCRDGTVRFQIGANGAQADLQIMLSMDRNVIGIQGRLSKIVAPWLRLYRHRDQAQRQYMQPDGRWRQSAYDYSADAAWNGPVDEPSSGTDGEFFWIRQRFPPEKTFPKGFEYVLVGLVPQPELKGVTTAEHRVGLGTPPSFHGEGPLRALESSYASIRTAPGAAATAMLVPNSQGAITAFVTVVTTAEAANPLAEAERRLLVAATDGFEKLQSDNAAWYGRLYNQRENGRVFFGSGGSDASEDVAEVFRSWYCADGGDCKPDMRRFEASSAYSCVEQDWQPWHGLPCFDALFATQDFVRNRADSLDMWWKLVEQWLPAARENARVVYGMPGMMLSYGYLPPVLPDRYVHTNCAMELCVDTAAQVVKVLWDQWDYGGDENFLKTKVYPALRDLAGFYAAYARLGPDGYLHFVPALEAEAWGIFPGFSRGQDSISSLCMARWAMSRAAEASELLGVDPELRFHWRGMMDKLAPYPVYPTPDGLVFNSMDGTVPSWRQGDHPWFIGIYPTILADEVTLDSTEIVRQQMIRTVHIAPAPSGAQALVLLGTCPDTVASTESNGGPAIADEKTLRDEVDRYPERLLNSRGGRIWLFPCVPQWANVAFRRFQARGGFLVSAVKDPTGIQAVEIESRRDDECRLMSPWPGVPIAVQDRTAGVEVAHTIDNHRGECLIFPVYADHDYVISQK